MPITLRKLGRSRWRKDDNAASRLVPTQRSRNKQLQNSHCWVTALQTSVFPRQQENTTIMEETFSTRSVPRCYKQDQLPVTVSKPRVEVMEYVHRSSANRRRRRNVNPVAGNKTGPPCSWGIQIRGPGLPGWGSLESETVKYGHISRGIRTI
jgi:hypothetical protein